MVAKFELVGRRVCRFPRRLKMVGAEERGADPRHGFLTGAVAPYLLITTVDNTPCTPSQQPLRRSAGTRPRSCGQSKPERFQLLRTRTASGRSIPPNYIAFTPRTEDTHAGQSAPHAAVISICATSCTRVRRCKTAEVAMTTSRRKSYSIVSSHRWDHRRPAMQTICKTSIRRSLAAQALASLLALTSASADACTRVVFLGHDKDVITARSMDWKVDIATNLWIFPRGMTRNGEAGPRSIEWTSKYGSVIASAYDNSTTDGLNEAGLAANVLWLVESGYPSFDGIKPGLTIAAWAQYVLDNFATVREAVDALRSEPFTIVTDKVPGLDRLATLHLSISDATGDSAIIEYIGGKQVIHHDRKYQVMTNSPTFDQQLALNAYWQQIGGTVMLPGTNRASDRFARASFYINAIPKDEKNPAITLASVFSVIRNVSVPYGISTPNEPNISSTRWRTVADHKRKLYFFESVLTPNTFWVDLKAIDFSAATGKVRKLDLGENQTNIFSGDTTANFKEAQPFRFQGL